MTSETRIIDGVAAVIHFSAMALTFHNDIDAPVYHPAFRGFIGGQGPHGTATYSHDIF